MITIYFTEVVFYNSKEEFTRVTYYKNHPFLFHTTRTSFKHKYVYCNGGVADYRSGTAIDITATAAVSGTAHSKVGFMLGSYIGCAIEESSRHPLFF